MGPLETEDAVDATRFQKARDPGRGGGFVGIKVDRVLMSASE